jgi:glycosyltransferase involved in cell wall biosynthesis
MKTPVTLVMPYYENPGMLSRQLASVRALPVDLRELVHVVVVDDGSPKNPAVAEDVGGASLQIYRIDEDVRWNQDAARNIGVDHAETNWVLLTDIDHMVPEALWRQLTSREWDREMVYMFRRVSEPDMGEYKPHPNSWFMSRYMFEKVGGYDERFAGYYGTDADFRDGVRAHAKGIKTIKSSIVRVPRTVTPDASTTTYLRKQPEDREGIARIKAKRAQQKDWRPLRGRFKYSRVHPKEQ